MPRVVADTNVYVSIYQFGGAITEIVELAQAGVIDLFISPPIMEELGGVLGAKFGWPGARIREMRYNLLLFTQLVIPQETLRVTSDPDDNRILECALEAGADVIVSGDRHLLKLRRFHTIPILSPREFLDAL